MIATQARYTESSTEYDSISWQTADPVTGTVGKMGYSSAGTSTDVENIEPLGQKIHPHDPADYAGPPASSVILGNADDPQWQCQPENAFILYGEFYAWPSACQMQYMSEMSIVPMTIAKKKSNPMAIKAKKPFREWDAPMPDRKSWSVAINSARTEALTATVKKTPETGEGCDPTDPDNPCVVEVNDDEEGPKLPEDLSYFSAEKGRVDGELVKGMKTAEEVLTDPKNDSCRALFKSLDIYNLNSAVDLLKQYKENNWISVGSSYQTEKGGKFNGTFKSRDTAAITMPGMHEYTTKTGKRGSAKHITINSNGSFFNPIHSSGKHISTMAGSGFYGLNQNQIRAAIIIHELLHAINAIPSDGPEVNDNGEQSRLNALEIQNACFK